MTSILVDYENVSSTDGLKGVEYLNEKDILTIFYSQCCEKIRTEYVEMIEKTRCEFKAYKLEKTGKNALDFYIAAECGFLSARGEKQICIISKDKGFSAVSDFVHMKDETEGITIHIASNIENALLALNALGDAERKRVIKGKVKALNIGVEQSRIREHKDFVNRITKLFEGTEYEKQTDNILKFMEECENKRPKLFYRNSLYEFGRDDGRAIYQMLKSIVT